MARTEGAAESRPRTRAPGGLRGLTAAFASLAIRDYRYMWFGQLSSATAMHADILARSWLTWQLTESTLAVALVNLMRAIPMLTLGLFGGVMADRFDKRRMLIIIQAWTLAVYLVIAVIVIAGWVELWHVYAYSFLIGLGFAMNQPVRMSFIPQLVGRKHLLNALSLSSIAINSTRLGGPAAIGFLIALAGNNVGPAYAVSAGFYAFALWTTTMIRPGAGAADSRRDRGSIFAQLLEGFRYIRDDRLILALVVVALGPLAFGHSYQTMLPAFVDTVLGSGAESIGAIQSVGAVGGLAGGLWIASRGNIPYKGRIMLLAGLAYGVVLMLFSWVTVFALTFPLVIVIGMSQTIFRASNTSTILESAPERMRGRIISVTLLDTAMGSGAAMIGGFIADQAGVSAGLFSMGAICFGIVALVALAYPAIRRI